MSDYYAVLKIQQGRLRAAMRDAGIKTAADLHRLCGVQQRLIGSILNFKTSPRRKGSGEWKNSILKICKALNVDPEYIFPEHLQHEVSTNQIEAYVEQAQLSGIAPQLQLNPEQGLELKETADVIDEVLNTLTDREQVIIRDGFLGGTSSAELARDFDLSRERVRQCGEKALRKLRHPLRARKLKEVYEFAT